MKILLVPNSRSERPCLLFFQIWLALISALLVGCASGPRDVVLLNSGAPLMPIARPEADRLARAIYNSPNMFDHGLLRGNQICTRGMDTTVRIRSASGGLFDVREPNNVDSGNFQVALTGTGGPPCGHAITKIDIELPRGLRVGRPSLGVARVLTVDGGVWTSDGNLFNFVLENVDTSVYPARSRGVFKFAARPNTRPGVPRDIRMMFVEGSFNLREFDFDPRFIP
jgi:hypothetical protein